MSGGGSSGGREVGLLILRVGIGVLFVLHGYPKITAGTGTWVSLGHAMGNLGINFLPVFWGFLAAFAEFAGGIGLILGAFFKISCALIAFDMVVAMLMHLHKGDGFQGAGHAIALLIVMIALMFMGAGQFSVAEKTSHSILK